MTVVLPEMTPVEYRKHWCARRHRTWRALGACLWPKAVWVAGGGTWASVAYCGRPTVWLWRTEAEARRALEEIGAYGCGGQCRQRHQLVHLSNELIVGVTR